MSHRNITLRQFRYFIAVAESSSVAAASRMLSIAQSAITKSILELEDTLGFALFERSPKGMVLTPDGHRFLASARKVLSAVADATRLHRAEPAPLSGPLSIGVTSLVAGYYLSELLMRFQRSCPAVQLHLVEESPPFLEHLLINGELDVAIMVSNALGEPQALVAETLTRSPNHVWRAAASYITGAHAMKFGLDGGFWDMSFGGSTPQKVSYRVRNGVPNQLTMEANPYEFWMRFHDFGLFAQEAAASAAAAAIRRAEPGWWVAAAAVLR